ncbi:hypothetical protein M0805_006463 [Coniferiporia weirii]|nr:hypothetical protein M0805_006463 [Coniferiporia weirii]
MTAMMSPPVGSHFMPTTHSAPAPRSGILLNASPCSSAPNSPLPAPYLLSPIPCNTIPSSLSSHSSSASSTSSTDDVASTSATSYGGTPALNPQATQNQHNSRKIRFAPLPEPRRDGYDDDFQLPGSALSEIDSAASSPRLNTLPPLALPKVIPPTPARPSVLDSNLLSVSQPAGSCSTLGLTFDGCDLPDSGQATETNTAPSSDCGTDDTQTAIPAKKPHSWVRLLRLTKHAPSRQGSGASRLPDESSGLSGLFRSSSRGSTTSVCSLRGLSASDANASTSSLGRIPSRRKSAGAESAVVPAFSFRGGFSLKPVISEAGTSSSPNVAAKKNPAYARAHASAGSAPPSVRRGTRLLNGRVYGARGALAANPFATARDTEPEFVEWGHGGMGSVRGARAAGSEGAWTALQSSRTLSVGHVADGDRHGDDDDGSGMGWVRRRREQREREKKESDEREQRERANGSGEANSEKKGSESMQGTASSKSLTTGADVSGPVAPADASEEKEVRDEGESELKAEEPMSKMESVEMTGISVAELAEQTEKLEPEHVYTAVTVPASKPKVHHHHSHSSNSGLSGSVTPVHLALSSAFNTPITNHSMQDLSVDSGLLAVAASVMGNEVTGVSTPTSASTSGSSFEDDDEDDEETPGKEREDEADEEDDEDEDEDTEGGEGNDKTRKTAIGAGVEKVSRHKE